MTRIIREFTEDEPRTIGRYGVGGDAIWQFFAEYFEGTDVNPDRVMSFFITEVNEGLYRYVMAHPDFDLDQFNETDLDPDWLDDFLRMF